MIKQQDEHEQQWWTNRQALIAKQEARVEGQKRLDDVLYELSSFAHAFPSTLYFVTHHAHATLELCLTPE